MPFSLYDHVRIQNKGITGEIIDVYRGSDGKLHYNVESDLEGPTSDPDAYNLRWPQFDCVAEQLEKL